MSEDPMHQIVDEQNRTYDFDPRHYLYSTHTQRIKSLHASPILAGGPRQDTQAQSHNFTTKHGQNKLTDSLS